MFGYNNKDRICSASIDCATYLALIMNFHTDTTDITSPTEIVARVGSDDDGDGDGDHDGNDDDCPFLVRRKCLCAACSWHGMGGGEGVGGGGIGIEK